MSLYLLNDVIGGQNDSIYKLLPTSVIWTLKINSLGQATKEISKTNNYNNQWFKLKLSTAQARGQKKLQHQQDLLKMLY